MQRVCKTTSFGLFAGVRVCMCFFALRSTASSPLLFPSDAPIDADHFDRFLEHFLCRENGCTKHMNREGTKPSHTKEMKDRSTLAQALHRYAARVSAQLKETLVQPLSDTIDSHSERLLAQTYERVRIFLYFRSERVRRVAF